MKIKNNKGFTMVEVLAVVTILGILAVGAVVAIQGVLKDAEKNYYSSQKDEMEMAARNYFEINRRLLPKVSGQKQVVYLNELQNQKFISKVVNYHKQDCDYEKSYVQVFKYEDEYYYSTTLVCPNYDDSGDEDSSNLNITVTYSGTIKNASATIKIKDEVTDPSIELGVVSYQYRIYSNDVLVYSSDLFDANKQEMVNKTISLNNYVPSNIKITVSATNIYGKDKTVSIESNNTFIDGTVPTCGIATTGESTEWTTGNRIITVPCIDENGSGCVRSVFTKEFTESTKIGYIQIKDKAGKTNQCPVNVYIDKTKPNVKVKVYKKGTGNDKLSSIIMDQAEAKSTDTGAKSLVVSNGAVNGWLNKENYPNGVLIEVDYDDGENGSGISKVEFKWNATNLKENSTNAKTFPAENVTTITPNKISGTNTFTVTQDGWRYASVIVTDKLGNTSTINITIPLDRVAPTCSKTGESTTWTKSDRSITINCNDSVSTCTSSPGVQKFTTTTKTKTYTLKDKAGNTSTCPVNVYVDKTAPSCGSITGQSTTWTANNRTISIGCSDSDSGCSSPSFSKNFSTSTKVGTITISDKVGNTKNCNVNAYVDKTAPTCGTITGASTTWTNGNRTIKVACNDSQSGCKATSVSKTFSSNTKTGTITITDKVGHSTNCSVNAYIDKTKPTCGTVTGASTSWTNSNRTIKVACNDGGESGCSAVSKTFSSTTKTSNITLKDGAGNSVSCPVNVYVDKTAPSCGSVTGESRNWTRNNRTITVKCSDSSSGCGSSSYTKVFDYTIITGSIKIYDKAGNNKTCYVDAYVDKDPPYTPAITQVEAYYGTTISNDSCSGRNLYSSASYTCSFQINFRRGSSYYIIPNYLNGDSGSGISYWQVKFRSNGSGGNYYPNWTNTSSLSQLNSGSGATYSVTEARAVDRVGNVSGTLNETMYINRY